MRRADVTAAIEQRYITAVRAQSPRGSNKYRGMETGMAYITIKTDDHGGLRTLHERLSRDDLDNAHLCERLIERMRWAVEDADPGHEVLASVAPRATHSRPIVSALDLRQRARSPRIFKEGEHVTVPNPDGTATVPAIFMARVNPDDVPEHGHDLAWIRYSEGEREGTTNHFRYADIKAVINTDTAPDRVSPG
jgi:hypothetical protein